MSPLVAVRLDDPRLDVRGALHIDRSDNRLRCYRLPAWTRAQSPEPAFDLMASMTSGVRLVFETTSEVLEIDALETGLQFAGEPRRTARFDLVCGARVTHADLTDGHTIVVDGSKVSFVAGKPGTLQFTLPSGRKVLELWLPQSAMTEIHGLRISAHAEIRSPPPPARTWAHYGSSISHGMEAESPSRTWPAEVARQLGYDLYNFGFAGQCHLDGFVARALRDARLDLISLKIGANIVAADTLRQRTFASTLEAFLDTIRDGCPNTPLLVISPVHSPLLETTPGPLIRRPQALYERQERPHAIEDGALTMKAARTILEAVVRRRRAAGDTNLHYIDGLRLFGESDTDLMPDQLHPDGPGHLRLAQRFCEAIDAHSWSSPTG